MSVPLFVSPKVASIDALGRLALLARPWQCARVTVVWMVGVVYAAAKFARPVKPRTRADEDVPVEPLRAVVARGSTAIRSDVIVPIGAKSGAALTLT